MKENSCMKHVDTFNMKKYNYVFNLNNPDDSANYCLNIPSIDERHQDMYTQCLKDVTKTHTMFPLNKSYPYDLSKQNNNICKHMEIRKCYEKNKIL